MDKFYAIDTPKIKKKFIEMKAYNNDINNKLNRVDEINKNNAKKLQKNTSWDNFMKFESFWVL